MRAAGVIVVALLLLTGPGLGAPERGARSSYKKIPADAAFQETHRFRGGERACVIAKKEGGNTGNEAVLTVSVYDSAQKLVASARDTLGFAAVCWYPPRSAEYRVQVRNHAGAELLVYISIK